MFFFYPSAQKILFLSNITPLSEEIWGSTISKKSVVKLQILELIPRVNETILKSCVCTDQKTQLNDMRMQIEKIPL